MFCTRREERDAGYARNKKGEPAALHPRNKNRVAGDHASVGCFGDELFLGKRAGRLQFVPSAMMMSTRKQSPIALVLVMVSFSAAQSRSGLSHQEFLRRLSAAAIERTHHPVQYVSAYVRIPYPGGDVPADTGVCTDEVIRSYRALGVDLQKEVHEDMLHNFSAYPSQRRWRRNAPDSNIDHRRVPNLMVFFQRKGETLPITQHPADYSPGDLVTWDLGGGVTHIGIVVDQRSVWSARYMIVHNIGEGPRMEDVLFNWTITRHYRYFGPN